MRHSSSAKVWDATQIRRSQPDTLIRIVAPERMRFNVLVCALILLVLLFWVAISILFIGADATLSSRSNIAVTYRRIKSLHSIEESLRNVEATQRTYLLTHQSVYLSAFKTDADQIRKAQHPEDGDRGLSPELIRAMSERLNALQACIDIDRRGEHRAAVDLVKRDAGALAVRNVQAEVKRTLAQRQDQLRGQIDQNLHAVTLVKLGAVISYSVGGLLATLASLLVYAEMRRQSLLERKLEWRVKGRTAEVERAQSLLREAEQRLQAALQFSHVAVWTWTPDADNIIWAGPVQDVFGVPGAALGSFADLRVMIHPDDQAGVDGALNHTFATGADYEAEFRIVSPDGRIRWIAGLGGALLEGCGRQRRMAGVNFDITEQKQAQEALRQSELTLRRREQQLALVFRHGNIGDWRWDIESDTLHAHQIVWELYGLAVEGSATASLVRERQHPDDYPVIKAAVEAMLISGAPLDLEFRVIRPDQSLRWIACRGFAVRREDNTPVECHGINIDITGRKLTELRLRESERQFRELAEAMPQIVWTAKADGEVEYFNQRWYEFHAGGFSAGTDKSWSSTLHEEDRDRCLDGWGAAVREGRLYEQECRLWHGNTQTYRWHLGRAVPVRDSAGLIIRWFGTWTDIHERKLAEERLALEVERRLRSYDELRRSQDELRASLTEKDVLLREVHHRVKNNLQIISSLLSMQASSVTDPASAMHLRDSERRVMSMAMIHEQLYGDSRMSAVDFAEYARKMTSNLFASLAAKSRMRCALNLSPTLLAIDQAIPCGLILNELITNALKYAYPAGAGEIRVILSRTSDLIHLSVSDDGVGFPPGFNILAAKSLGLKIIRVLARQLRGELSLSSEAGASITICFPADK